MKFLLLLLAITVLGTPANAQQPSTPDDAAIHDRVYDNRFFGFSYTFPKDWIVHGGATNTEIKDLGKQRMVGSGAMSASEADALIKNTYQLLTVSQRPLGTPGTNSMIQVVAENVSHVPALIDGRNYLLHVGPVLAKTGAQFTQIEPIEMKLAGRTFFRRDHVTSVNGLPIHQTMVVGGEKGYVLVFIFTSTERAQVEETLKTLTSLAFKSSLAKT
jgi:hypothetical protein